jgi:hypothetical protein
MADETILDAFVEMRDTSASQYNTPTNLHTESTAIAILTVGRLLVNTVEMGFQNLCRSINSKG